MRHRNRVMQDRQHTFTLALSNGRVLRLGDHSELRRCSDLAAIIERFAKHITHEVNITFIIDDQPAIMLPWAEKNRMIELAGMGERT